MNVKLTKNILFLEILFTGCDIPEWWALKHDKKE